MVIQEDMPAKWLLLRELDADLVIPDRVGPIVSASVSIPLIAAIPMESLG